MPYDIYPAQALRHVLPSFAAPQMVQKKENFIGLTPKLSGGEKLDLEKAREANGEW